MKLLILLFGLFILVIAVVGFVRPSRLLEMARWARQPLGFATAIVLRVVMGLVLVLGAPACRFTLVLQIFGVVAILAGLGLIVLGRNRFSVFIDRWLDTPPSFIRAWLIFAVAFGGFLVYAAA